MWCPQCGKDTRVVETEKLTDTVTRVRWCRNSGCKLLFETREVLTAGSECSSKVAAVAGEQPPGRSRKGAGAARQAKSRRA